MSTTLMNQLRTEIVVRNTYLKQKILLQKQIMKTSSIFLYIEFKLYFTEIVQTIHINICQQHIGYTEKK